MLPSRQRLRALAFAPLLGTCVAGTTRALAEGGAAGGPPMSSTTIGLGVESLGLAPYPMPSKGARLSVVTAPGREIEATYIEAEKTVLLAEVAFSEAELRYRAWLSDSVYVGLGIGYRDVTVAYDVFMADDAPDEHVEEQHKMLTASAHFGAEYQVFGFVFVGIDLFGVSSPVKELNESDDFPEGAANYEEDPETYPYINSALGTSYHVARTYVKVRI